MNEIQSVVTSEKIIPRVGVLSLEDAELGKLVELEKENIELVKKIKAITARGNDVEIRQKRDGKLAIYEIRKKAV